MRMHALAWAPIFAGACCNQGAALRARHLCLTPSEPTPQVNGKRYALFECIYLRPWPNAEPWIARIEEILSRIGKTNKVESVLCVRWFYQRHQLLPSGEGEFPPCSNADREVYRSTGKPDEVQLKTLIGSCSVAAASEVPNLKAFLADDDAFFYQYEYSPLAKEKREPLFRLLDGAEQPAANGGAVAEEALQQAAGVQLPHADGAVVAAGEEQRAPHVHAAHRVRVPAEQPHGGVHRQAGQPVRAAAVPRCQRRRVLVGAVFVVC